MKIPLLAALIVCAALLCALFISHTVAASQPMQDLTHMLQGEAK